MPPPNTPEEGEVPANTGTTTLALRPFVRTDASSSPLDLRALEYQDSPDENLICPICRMPFVSPVITSCDHVFCQKCIFQAHVLNPVCPVDRLPLELASDTYSAPKIIHNQLDSLMAKCPNSIRGCNLTVARSLIENHVSRYCDKTLVPCPHPSCNKTVVRKDAGKGCLHYDVECEYCNQVQQKADLEHHQNSECPNRKTNCKLCSTEFVRHKQDEHNKECPEAETTCTFAPFGCPQQMPRKSVRSHAHSCDYRVVGPVGDQLAEVRAELHALQERDRLKERRIKFLENKGFSLPSTTSSNGIADISLPETSSSAENAPYDSRDQYFLSLFETMESKVERLSSALNEVEGRHSMMLFNETLPIKDQLTEIRNTMGVLGMHVRWLMNFRLQERGRVMAGSPSMNGPFSNSHDSGNDSNLPRRLSDHLRENPARL